VSPLLDESDLAALHARPLERCPDCKALVRWNYCRQHDEFFTVGHSVVCRTLDATASPSHHNRHDAHRTY
jgi:hypothetical protein